MTDDATPFALVVRFTVRPEAEASFDDLTARTARLIRDREPGTLVYATHQVPDSPRVRVFYELYRDREAFGAHEEQDHVRAFLAEREPMLEATEVTFMGLMDGKVPLELPR
jgi:quinol monooxygenase YgiN